jgi:Tfp pilus assembly protein PilZ
MLTILLHSISVDEATHIKTFVEKHLPYEVMMSFNTRDTEDALTSKSIQALFFNAASFESEDFVFVREMRSLGFSQPILVIASGQQKESILHMTDKYKLHFLEKPYEMKALRGISRKLLLQKNIHQQVHRRFGTNQQIEVEVLATGSRANSHMFNLSKGGAYCEFADRPTDLTLGDIVRLKIGLPDIDRHHTINARTMWTTRKGTYSGGHGVGFKFLRDGDVYRHMLEKM